MFLGLVMATKQFLSELFEYHPNWVIAGCIITALVCFYVMID